LSEKVDESLFLANNLFKRFEFIAPEFLFFELGKHLDEIKDLISVLFSTP